MKMLKKKVFIAGHNGMVGSAILRRLQADANITLVLASRSELNLLNAKSVKQFFEDRRPDEVYLAAARVGGIYANSSFPAEFISQNLQIQNNIIQTAHDCSVQRLLFLGSSSTRPRVISTFVRPNCLTMSSTTMTFLPMESSRVNLACG